MKAIVLAGGLGTRLRERVPDLPKVMAPIAGRPFLEYVLDRLIAGGVMNVVLSVGFCAEMIIKHVGDRYHGATISYATETEPLGTGGAILNALPKVGREPVIICNGDTFLDVDYSELAAWYSVGRADFAMVLRTVDDVTRYGAVLVQGDSVIGFSEKGIRGRGLINTGVYIVDPDVLKTLDLPNKFSFETDVLQRYCGILKPRAFLTDAYFVDIGIPADYDRAQHELIKRTHSSRI